MSAPVKLHVDRILTWEAIKKQLAQHGASGRVWAAKRSCWWTTHRGHLYRHPDILGAGADPLGGEVVEIADWPAFVVRAEARPEFYGRHGLETLVAAHHSNARRADTGAPWASRKWADYDAALDDLLAQEAGLNRKK